MGLGTFVLMLHSHLPFYRKAGMWPFGEENLYECMGETYIPLANMLNELLEEGIQAKVTLGITPILLEQLADEHLKAGFVTYMETRIQAAEEDVARYPDPAVEHSDHLAFLAGYYRDHFRSILHDFNHRYGQDLVGAFKRLQDAGAIEITTSSATHGFSPLLSIAESVNGQFRAGVETYQRYFERQPRGYWLPECAYRPARSEGDLSTDAYLYENGLEYFFTEYHAIEGATPAEARQSFGIYGNIEYVPLAPRPVTGLTTFEAYWMKSYPVAVMGRNNRASFQVWSAAHGYPGEGLYREFHKKDEQSGLHYWRLTSKETDIGDKMLYDPVKAFNHVDMQAEHFAGLCEQLVRDYHDQSGETGLLMVSFDTELYGHWWYEGVAWLKAVIKRLHENDVVDVETAGEYLVNTPPTQAVELPESTWGEGGHYSVWSNPDTDWMWPVIHEAEARFLARVEHAGDAAEELTERVLNQAFRELLLLQSSDWPFLVTTMQAKDYAVERFEGHVANFNQLCDMLESGSIDETVLAGLEEQNNPFAHLDYRWYQKPTKVDAQASQPSESVSAP